MIIQKTGKRSVNCLTEKSVAVILSLALSLSGCALVGMFVPAHSSVEFDDPNPLKGSIANVRTLAVLTTGTSGGMDTAGMMEKAASGTMAGGGLLSLYSPKIAGALQQNPRFHIITPYEVEKAVGVGGAMIQMSPSMTEAEKARHRAQAILNAGRSVKADGVILIEEEKDLGMGMGSAMMGRMTAEYRVTMTVFSTETGAVLWRQKAINSVNAALDTSTLFKQVDPELVSAIVQNFNATMK